MASDETLRQRPSREVSSETSPPSSSSSNSAKGGATQDHNRRARKLAMARRGLRSLLIAIFVPLALSALSAYLSGSGSRAVFAEKRTWTPPVWAFHLASACTASLMGLSAWLVWAEGAFHHEPPLLAMFIAQFLLGLVWAPLVFNAGALRAGLLVCVALFVVMFMCSQCFAKVNPIAGDVIKPCLAWVSFLILFNYKLLG